ncbi:hypothetical protein K469DRAFT_704095 [Zopfia rhizophila CBS 207.26]|uniref:Uncharacterized protein n=1 Tax=Zopfia rhizophila CBS 207.26 TaxID=1314779 RepID=A0A6A6DB23_9PEZI|nr:hypothetical protein K469DRAFT_704095 [Zopfia rhizophila CBS 207.26]
MIQKVYPRKYNTKKIQHEKCPLCREEWVPCSRDPPHTCANSAEQALNTAGNAGHIRPATSSNPVHRFIWVPINPLHQSIEGEHSLGIDFLPINAELNDHFPWFNRKDANRAAKELGATFVQNLTELEQPVIYQGIVTM